MGKTNAKTRRRDKYFQLAKEQVSRSTSAGSAQSRSLREGGRPSEERSGP
tara:strand:- start:269 stop:418 length:150 start_codon:yes stop_codon:yes gene_type:complete